MVHNRSNSAVLLQEALASSLGSLRTSHHTLSGVVDELYGRLDVLRLQLEEREESVHRRSEELENREDQLRGAAIASSDAAAESVFLQQRIDDLERQVAYTEARAKAADSAIADREGAVVDLMAAVDAARVESTALEAGRQECQQRLDAALAQLEQLRTATTGDEAEAFRQCIADLNQQIAETDARAKAADAEIAKRDSAVTEMTASLQAARTETAALDSGRQECQQRLDAALAELEQLRIATTGDESAEIGRLLADLEEARAAATASREDIDRVRQDADQVRGQRDRLVADLAVAQQELDALAQQKKPQPPPEYDPAAADTRIAELDAERRELESELEAVRQRVADLSEALSDQRRQIAEERAEWTVEIRQLRRQLETEAPPVRNGGAKNGSARPVPATERTAARSPQPVAAHAAPRGGHDPVVGSVMAQFEMLQQQRAKRRSKL